MPAKIPEQSALLPLIEGYKRFKQTYFEQSQLFDDLVLYGQEPKVLVVACCDSRVDPAILTHCQPGELFVVRNVANLIPPFNGNAQHHGTSAALEFGVIGLNVSDIIVFGHSHCGGIRALMSTPEEKAATDFIGVWMDIAKPAKQTVLQAHPNATHEEKTHLCEKEALLISLNNLSTFPWIQKRVSENRLFLHAWYFDLASGMVETYDQEQNGFRPLDAETG